MASQNPDKVAEVEEVLAGLADHIDIVRGLSWPEVAETEPTLEGNALLKARAVVAATGISALSDDTGLEVDALGGQPGVHTARYAGHDSSYEENIAKVLAELDGVENRSARFRTVVAFVTPEGDVETAEGILEGDIISQPRGDGGFGYDPIFEVGGRTLAEIPSEEKHRISHRGKALAAIAESLALS